jgi:hypothetical protein
MERKEIFELALKIQKIFKSFYLAGATAITFKYNHRQSFDLDFFNYNEFSYNRISKKIRQHFKVTDEQRLADNIDFYIHDIRVSFVFFPFKNIKRLQNVQGLKVASDYDLFLNKIYSAGRRVEPKDPYDAAFLYKIHKWKKDDVKKDFEKKFPDQSFEIYIGALLSFEDYGEIEDWVKETLLELIEK